MSGYERFRPNIRPDHSKSWFYRGGWHQPCPLLPFPACNTGRQSSVRKTLGVATHTFVHWRVFATAKPRKARSLVSVSDSGLQLPLPIPIVAMVVLYTASSIIGRSPILRPVLHGEADLGKIPFQAKFPIEDYPQFPVVVLVLRAG